MANRSSKQAEMGITEYSVSDNGIMNRNAIIRAGRDLAREDDASSVQFLFSSSSNIQTPEPTHPDPKDEATSCWVVGKAILQSHEDNHLMTQTLQGFSEKEQEEWTRRKKQCDHYSVLVQGMVIIPFDEQYYYLEFLWYRRYRQEKLCEVSDSKLQSRYVGYSRDKT